MSRLSTRFGNIRVLMGVVVLWIVICVAAYRTATSLNHYRCFMKKLMN